MKKPKMPKFREKLTAKEEFVARLLVAGFKEPEIKNILEELQRKNIKEPQIKEILKWFAPPKYN